MLGRGVGYVIKLEGFRIEFNIGGVQIEDHICNDNLVAAVQGVVVRRRGELEFGDSLTYPRRNGGIGTYGGMHPKTIPSFIIAQGHYVPFAIIGLWLVRRYHITRYEMFFVAGVTALYEAITVGGPVLLSPMFVLSPIVIAYYFVVYSIFLSMGLQFIDERLLWDTTDRHISFGRKILYGAILGIIAWAIFAIWGEIMIYLFDGFKSF